VPMDGRGSAIEVGPPGACSAAAWSPDGEWMYFNAKVRGAAHLWRQRWRNHAPAGDPEQITFGPTEEEGLAVAPDGRSLIASVGLEKSSVWIHDASGERMISQEGSASHPRLSADGKRVYYLLQRNSQSEERELWMKDLASGRDAAVLTGLRTSSFEISRDEALVAFIAGKPGAPEIHVAPTDRSAPPRLLVRGGDSISIAGSQLIFRQYAGKTFYLARIGLDGKGAGRILDTPIDAKFGVSPDGAWISLASNGTYLVSTQGKPSRQICRSICDPQWSADGRYMYVTLGYLDDAPTYVVPFPKDPGELELPGNLDQLQTVPPGLRLLAQAGVSGGIDADTYILEKSTFQGNLFRIPLH
jgi:eukaryotic-like serine/threonine-protein kinase